MYPLRTFRPSRLTSLRSYPSSSPTASHDSRTREPQSTSKFNTVEEETMITPPTQEETCLESMPSKPDFEPAPGFANESVVASGELARDSDVPTMPSSSLKLVYAQKSKLNFQAPVRTTVCIQPLYYRPARSVVELFEVEELNNGIRGANSRLSILRIASRWRTKNNNDYSTTVIPLMVNL